MDAKKFYVPSRTTEEFKDLISLARRDSDFDLFCRRLDISEALVNLSPELWENIELAEWYSDFWRLASEVHRSTKFSAEEKNIRQQMLEAAELEKNPIRRQCFALVLLFLGEFQEFSKLVDQSLWSPSLKKDFATFVKWDSIINSPLTSKAREIIFRNKKILSFLQEKYSALIKKHSKAVINDKICPRVSQKNYQIYFCWLQGEENLPPIVRCCYNSLKQNAGHYKIVFIDEKNFSKYVDIAPHIIDKFRAGKISRTHFSDILRVNLLERYAGLWLDSTILVTESLEHYKKFWQMNYFTQKFLHEVDYANIYNQSLDWCVSYGRWATFLQGTSILHNPLFIFEKDFYNEYWQDFDEVIDYVLMDFMMNLAYNNIASVREEMDAVPINNTEVWVLVNHLKDLYSEFPFDKILNNTFLHKLDWKVPIDMAHEDTVFKEILKLYT